MSAEQKIYSLLFIILSANLFSQKATPSMYEKFRLHGLIAGYDYRGGNFLELGIYSRPGQYFEKGSFPAGALGVELSLGKPKIIGYKAQVWVADVKKIFGAGVNIIYYRQGVNSSFAIRPEIGIAKRNFKIVYGYNLNLSNGISFNTNHQLSLILYAAFFGVNK